MNAFTHALPWRLKAPPAADVALAIVIFTFGLLEITLSRPGHLWPDAAIAACATLPLSVRRRAPIVPVVGVSSALLLFAAAGEKNSTYLFALVSTLLSLYSLGAYGKEPVRIAGLLGSAACAVISALSEPAHGASDALFATGVVAAPWLVGVVSHRREHVAAGLRERADRLERNQAERERRAVATERERIARELHDIIAHAVTLMVVQANAGERQVRSNPAAAEQAFAVVKQSGKAALGDLRRMLDLLRADADSAQQMPQLSAGAIEELVQTARRTGAAVTLDADPIADLPESSILAVYRLVQEALTNATRHAHGAPIAITLRRSDAELRLTVGNGAGRQIAEPDLGGYGLVGMRERVAVFEGAFDAHPTPDGGFLIEASLPLGGAS